jgi:hypothetical protein
VGKPLELLGGLLILGPLYGGPALIIRDVARRSRRGWPTIILMASAFGVFQAGLVDQSMFNPSYRDIDYWDESRNPTFIPLLGLSAHMAMNFVGGHVIWSIGAPIAVIEALVPTRAATPWLGWIGLMVTSVVYALASALILSDHVQTEQFLAPAPQLIGTAVVVVALIGAGFATRPRDKPTIDQAAPAPCWSELPRSSCSVATHCCRRTGGGSLQPSRYTPRSQSGSRGSPGGPGGVLNTGSRSPLVLC